MTESIKAVVLPDRKIVAISGTDRVKFLQGLMTNDIRRLTPDRALYTGFLNGQGKLLCDAFVLQDGDRILIDIAAAFVEDFVKRLSAFKLREAVGIGETAPALAVAAVWGTGATARLELDSAEGAVGNSALAEAQYSFVDPRIAALGARLVYSADFPIEAKLARLGFASATAADYAEHRLALGIADTAEIGGEVCYPLEANFEMLHGVDFKKGCYVGQELTARMKLKGELRKRILPVSGSAPLPRVGTPVTADGTELGPLIAASGTRGLALLRLDRLADAKEEAIRAQDVQLSILWPNWLPR
ncbi:MAG: YgfZ/GcvT domain-containing protein [Bradyrhizobium sp.]